MLATRWVSRSKSFDLAPYSWEGLHNGDSSILVLSYRSR